MNRKIIMLFLAISLLFTGCSNNCISANEWLLCQDSVCADLKQASLSCSDIVTLYISGAIAHEDFINEVLLIKNQIQLSQMLFLKSQQNIEPGSHSFVSKCGQEGLTAAYEETLTFLSLISEEKSRENILYHYLKWEDAFIAQISTYLTAKNILQEAAAHE